MDEGVGTDGLGAIAGYRDFTVIGRGASSTVYRAHDEELRRWVAIKVFLADDPGDPARRRFRREREISANLGKHPHIVQVLGTGFSSNQLPYVVMELFEQGSIADHIRNTGPFTSSEVVDIGTKVADAVDAAHRAGVLHRDIKPQNVLLSEYGPALADFGIARSSANLEWSQSLDHLTPMHAAPEILLGGAPTPQADIYSLGSTIYTMLAGRAPFGGPGGESLLQYQLRVSRDEPAPLTGTDVPPRLAAVIMKSLAKAPSERYSSAGEFRDALRRAGASDRVDGMPPITPSMRLRTAPEAPLTDEITVAPTGLTISPSDLVDDRAPSAVTSLWAPGGTVPGVSPAAPEGGRADSTTTSPGPPLLDPDSAPTVIRSHPVPPLPELEEEPPRRPLRLAAIGAGAVVAIVVLVAVIILLTPSKNPKNPPVTLSSGTTVPVVTEGAPVNLTATLGSAGNSAVLRWTSGTGVQTGYAVLQVPESGKTSLISPGPTAGATDFTVAGLDPESAYCFIVIALVGTHAAEAPSCVCVRGGTLAPQSNFPHLTCNNG